MKLNKAQIIGITSAVIVSGILLLFVPKKDSERYQTAKIKKCTITEIVEASGTINPVNIVSVGSTVSGLVKDIYVDFNSEVTKGQVLAQMDPTTFEASVQQHTASVNNAKANLARLQAEADMKEKTYNRYKNLYARHFVAKSELDQAESDFKSITAQIKAAKAQVAQAQAQFDTAKANLSYTKILAPVNGTVISRQVDVGQPVAASFQAPELFTIAQDLTKMQIEVSVSEADIGHVKEGQEVTYTLDGYPDENFLGYVSQVRISPTTVSNVVTYSVIVDVENKDLKLKPGMTANVSIITEKSEDINCAPNRALKVSLDNNRYENLGIWLLKNNKPVRVDIKAGVSDDNVFEVISDEVKENDIVVTGVNSNQINKGGPRRMMP